MRKRKWLRDKYSEPFDFFENWSSQKGAEYE